MNLRYLHSNSHLLGLACVLCLAHTASANFVTPTSWSRGDVNTTFQEWDNFSTPIDAEPDAFDNNPNGPALLTENTGSVFITSTGNLYSFSQATDFTVTVPVEDLDDPEVHDLTVVVQIQTLGSELDYSAVQIEGVSPVDSAILNASEIGGEFGGITAQSWFLFNLDYAEFADGSGDVTEFELTFHASESSMSLERVLIDTALRASSLSFFDEPNPVAPSLVGDYDADGFVSQSDLDLVLLNWGDASLPTGWLATDQLEGAVSQNELDGVLLNWGDGTPPSLAAVPEPTSLALLGLTGVAFAARRRRGAQSL